MVSGNGVLVAGTGDAYRYTIQPVFENMSEQRHCHIRRRRHDDHDDEDAGHGRRRDTAVLYEVFYYVQLPAAVTGGGSGGTIQFQTPRVRRTVRRTDTDELTPASSASSQRIDFLNVEHDAGLELQVGDPFSQPPSHCCDVVINYNENENSF